MLILGLDQHITVCALCRYRIPMCNSESGMYSNHIVEAIAWWNECAEPWGTSWCCTPTHIALDPFIAIAPTQFILEFTCRVHHNDIFVSRLYWDCLNSLIIYNIQDQFSSQPDSFHTATKTTPTTSSTSYKRASKKEITAITPYDPIRNFAHHHSGVHTSRTGDWEVSK